MFTQKTTGLSFTRHLAMGVLGVALSGGCSQFGVGQEDVGPLLNVCNTAAQCRLDEQCQDGQCVVQQSEDLKSLVLQITPEYTPTGHEALPVYAELARIGGTTRRDIELKLPTDVRIRLRSNGQPIAGELRVTTVSDVPGLAANGQTFASKDGLDISIPLPLQSKVRVVAVPADPTQPPVEQTFEVTADLTIDLDVDDGPPPTRLRFEDVPPDSSLQVVALAPATGRRISSIAAISDGRAELRFASGHETFRLEISSASPSDRADSGCDASADLPATYRLTLDRKLDELEEEVVVQLPRPEPAIRYSGNVDLCSQSLGLPLASLPPVVDTLTVNLRSDVLRTAPTQNKERSAEAYLQQDLPARYNRETNQYEFCGRTIPGTYEVVVNAPASLTACVTRNEVVECGCGIFAEPRLIQAPPGTENQFGALLSLPPMASVRGTVRRADTEAVVGASVEAVALRSASGIELAANDRGLTTYNRSRQTTSDSDGAFQLPLDVGAYDITIKPPGDSGFAWTVIHDVRIANRTEAFPQEFTAGSPVSVTGQLGYKSASSQANASLGGAVIRAYRVIDDEDNPGQKRAIALGLAIADAEGHFELHVPDSILDGWP